MRIIATGSLKKFWERPGCADAQGPLQGSCEEAPEAKWRTPQDIKDQFASAGICGNSRVVFNVGGNKNRLVVEVLQQAGIVWVKFIGTHVPQDRIDLEIVNGQQADPKRRRPQQGVPPVGRDIPGRRGHGAGR